jgi:hypothetical protein
MMITEIGPIGPALALLAVCGVIISYVLLRREMRSELAKLREMVEAQPAGSNTSPLTTASETKPAPPAITPIAKKSKQDATPVPMLAKDEVTPEILAVISAAVAQFLGAGARIRATRLIPQVVGMNAWAQQGRVIIQASHNLGAR